MAYTVATAGVLARLGLEKRVKLYSTKQTNIRSKFIKNQFTDNQSYTEIAQLNDFGMAGVVSELDGVPYDVWRLRFTKQYRPVMRALGFQVTEPANITDLYGEVTAPSKKMALAMNKTREQVGTNVLVNAFSTATANLGHDGLPLCSTAHLLESGTGSNRPSTDIPFSKAALQQGVQELASQKSDKGDPFPSMGPFILVGSTSDMIEMSEVVNATGIAQSANNDGNELEKYISGIVTNPYLTSTTAWWLVTAVEEENPLFWLSRIPLRSRQGYDEDYLLYKYVMFEEYVASFWGWRGVWGTTGA